MSDAYRRRVEVLGFRGCPNLDSTREMVERLVAELHVEAEVRWIEVGDPSEAARLRFLGSPSVRVDGLDVEPGFGHRDEYVLSCRVYPGPGGLVGTPPEAWVREALLRA